MEITTREYPALLIEVPHQRQAQVYYAASESKLMEICECNAGDNYEWPGHWDGEGDNEQWVDERKLDDYLAAFSHDLNYGRVLFGKDEVLEFLRVGPLAHQGVRVRLLVEDAARDQGWIA